MRYVLDMLNPEPNLLYICCTQLILGIYYISCLCTWSISGIFFEKRFNLSYEHLSRYLGPEKINLVYLCCSPQYKLYLRTGRRFKRAGSYHDSLESPTLSQVLYV